MIEKEFEAQISFLNKHNTKNNAFKVHTHSCYEIIFFLEGNGRIIIGDREYSVEADTYCIIAPGTEHIECMDGYGEVAFIGFDFENSKYSLKHGIYYGKRDKLLLFENIFEEYKNQLLGFEEAARAQLNLILLDALRSETAAEKRCKDLNYIRTYIEQHFDQKIDFNSLAKLSGYSYDYFRHIFKGKFGVSPQQYMIDIRLKNADDLLKTTSKTCTEIAYCCGFSNGGQLSVMYKARLGKTPKEIRNNRFV